MSLRFDLRPARVISVMGMESGSMVRLDAGSAMGSAKLAATRLDGGLAMGSAARLDGGSVMGSVVRLDGGLAMGSDAGSVMLPPLSLSVPPSVPLPSSSDRNNSWSCSLLALLRLPSESSESDADSLWDILHVNKSI